MSPTNYIPGAIIESRIIVHSYMSTADDQVLSLRDATRLLRFCRQLQLALQKGIPIAQRRQSALSGDPCYNVRVKSSKELAREVHDRLKAAYGPGHWRKQMPPLDELISTILSQNTNDLNRDRAFQSLKDRFGSWERVRDAAPDQVINAIRSAGLANQKGPRIQLILKAISEQRGELDLGFLQQLPAEQVRSWLLQFKGVGPKTAAIVMLFSLGMPAFPVDTHIYRVTGRLGLRNEKVDAVRAHAVLEELFPPEAYHDAHLNLIRHGREACHPRRPECERCVLQDLCRYYSLSFLNEGRNVDNRKS